METDAERIVRLLKENNEADDYRIKILKTKSTENFFVHSRLETVRKTDTGDINVTVYKDGEIKEGKDKGKKFRGDSSFTVYPYMSDGDIREAVNKACIRAGYIKNEPYKTPEGGKSETLIPSDMREYDEEELVQKIADAIFAGCKEDKGSLNAVEVFVYRQEERIINSRGTDKTAKSVRAMAEIIPTWTEDGKSVELYESENFGDFSPKNLTLKVRKKMAEVKDRMRASKPEVPFTSDVMFLSGEIKEILSALSDDLNFAAVYSHANVHKKGDLLAKNAKGDRITLTMAKAIKGSPYSREFDGDGAELKDTLIIDGNKVTGYYGSSRFAQYLNEEPTGDLPCICLKTGSLSAEDIKGNYLEVASMSGIQVDLYNDYIGGEVRLAYYHKEGKKVPVTGISLSAKLSSVLSHVGLSKSLITDDYYNGPDFMLAKGFSVI